MTIKNEEKILDNINNETEKPEEIEKIEEKTEKKSEETEENNLIQKNENSVKNTEIDSLKINIESYDSNGNDEIENNFPLVKNPENFSSLPNPSRSLIETLSQKRLRPLSPSIPTSEKPIRLRKPEYREVRNEHPLDNFKEERYATKAEAYLSGYIAGNQAARKGKI